MKVLISTTILPPFQLGDDGTPPLGYRDCHNLIKTIKMKKAFLSSYYGNLFTGISPILASVENGYPYVLLLNGSKQLPLMLSKSFCERNDITSHKDDNDRWVITNENKSLGQFDLTQLVIIDDMRGQGLRLTNNGAQEGALDSNNLAAAFGVQPVASTASTTVDTDAIGALLHDMMVERKTTEQRA